MGCPVSCLFCKIASGEIPAHIIFENDDILAFRDIHPQAPTHVLVIPKRHIETLNHAEVADESLLGQMVLTAQNVAKKEGLDQAGYRLVMNINQHGGQTVYHIHLHMMGGRQMSWPPG
jgi:histidine triad (HIT) family protein